MLTLSPKIVSDYRDSAYQLQLSALSLEDSGVYTCIVENDSGKTRCSAELIVLDERDEDDMNLRPPVFTQGIPQKLYAKEGRSFEFRVKLQGLNSGKRSSYILVGEKDFTYDLFLRRRTTHADKVVQERRTFAGL